MSPTCTVFLFLLLLLPPTIKPSSPSSDQNSLELETMITRACTGLADQNSCIAVIQSEIRKMAQPRDHLSVIHAALQASLDEARRAAQMMSSIDFPLSENPRQDMAIGDCKELVDFSVSEIAWSMAEMRRIRAGLQTPHSDSNLRAWLSAALGNQDTCLDGFDATDRRVETLIRGGLRQLTQLVTNVLVIYTDSHSLPFKPSKNDTAKWIWEGDPELLHASPGKMSVDAVVAADGSGQYRTITEAVSLSPNQSQRRYVIYVKKGVYNENVDLKRKKTNIMMVGDGVGETVVTGDRSFKQGWTTFRTATVAVSGNGFIARDMTFRNTAGPENFQAVALRVDSDQSAFFRCSMEGYQDTLYSHSLRQFFRECEITGTVDFLFGNSAAVLQNCNLVPRKPLPLQKVTVTAQGRKELHQSTGFVVQGSRVSATVPTYLGRPWKKFSRTVFIDTYMSSMVLPSGWVAWYGGFALNTLYYGEYQNYGPGASLSGRVSWPGYHVIREATEAAFFSVRHFIDGMSWLPSTGIRFSAGCGGR